MVRKPLYTLEQFRSENVLDNHELTLTWKNLSVYVKVRKQKIFGRSESSYKRLINNVTGAVKGGNMVILIGPSGAGKSSLMGALAHRNANDVVVEGDVRINGQLVGNTMHKLSGFMHQEDLFVGTLTVREHLHFMARLKLDKCKTERDINRVVNKILTQMSLLNCANTRIGAIGGAKGISGGERKRLSFATETLTDPPILFCDEPTTGLDSFSAEYLVNLMKQMSSSGKIILCTIHQPSSDLFAMFQQLILFTDGRIAFMGNTENCLQFFQKQGYDFPPNYNPAEILIKALSISSEEKNSLRIQRLCDAFALSETARETDELIGEIIQKDPNTSEDYINKMVLASDRKHPSFFVKLYWLTYRSMLHTFRDSSIQNVRILQKMGIALMASLCFFGTVGLTQTGVQSVQGAIFILVTENTFPPMYGVLSIIPGEFPLFIREYKSNLYSTHEYYISKILSLLPGLIIEPVLFVLIAYFITGLKRTLYAFLMTTFIALLTTNVAVACGCFFSCVFESVSIALAFLVPVDYTLMVTSGVFIKLSSMPSSISWFQYFSWFMYANEALTIVQWENVKNITCEYSNPNIPCLTDGADVLKKFDFSVSDLYKNIMAMSTLFCAFHILAYAFLWRRTKKNSS